MGVHINYLLKCLPPPVQQGHFGAAQHGSSGAAGLVRDWADFLMDVYSLYIFP